MASQLGQPSRTLAGSARDEGLFLGNLEKGRKLAHRRAFQFAKGQELGTRQKRGPLLRLLPRGEPLWTRVFGAERR